MNFSKSLSALALILSTSLLSPVSASDDGSFGDEVSSSSFWGAASRLLDTITEERMAASDMITALQEELSQEGFAPSEACYTRLPEREQGQNLFWDRDRCGVLQIVTAPAHDLSNEDRYAAKCVRSGNLALETLVSQLIPHLEQADDAHVLIPLAQGRQLGYTGLLGERNHWTLVFIRKQVLDDDVLMTAFLLDPRGKFSEYYGTGHISEALAPLIGDSQPYHKSIGHQAITNGTECGHFVFSYIIQLLENANTSDLQSFKSEGYIEMRSNKAATRAVNDAFQSDDIWG